MAKKKYRHLIYEDRVEICALKKSGETNSAIARQLSVNRSTISRELRRNKGGRLYRYTLAHKLSQQRRQLVSSILLKMTPKNIKIIEHKLSSYQWSPVQISGRLKDEMKINISHESIYKHIWKDKLQGGLLYKHLRHRGKKYTKRKGKTSGRGVIPNRKGIEDRPKIVEAKKRKGDWEIDTIIGKNHIGAIVSMVDRATKFAKLFLIKRRTALLVKNAIVETLLPMKDFVLTLTADNGKEFAMHEEIAASLNAKMYFARPYHSWERGLNEHTNGLIRQYLPKKTRFDQITDEDVQKVEDLLNSRPRKVLGFKTPFETFYKAKLKTQFVALQS